MSPVFSSSSFLCSLLLLALIFKIFHKLWWNPTRIQKLMSLQGINGPPYRLIHGNTKEISSMHKEAMSRPKNLSHDIFSHVQPHYHSWIKAYGKNFLQWHGSQAQLIITEPELCKEILNNKDRAFPKCNIQGFMKKLLGDGLVTTNEGDKWGKMRKLANSAFHGESLKSMIPATIASSELMLERWKNHEEGKEIEIFEEFRLLTSEVISRTAFGSSYIEGKNIFDMLMTLAFLSFKNVFKPRIPIIRSKSSSLFIFSRVLSIINFLEAHYNQYCSKLFKTKDDIESEKLEKGIRDSIIQLVKKREQTSMTISGGEQEQTFGSDFLGLLLKAHHDTNDYKRITVDDVVDECKTFYFGGQETTNSLLAWTVLLLALHTDWQEEARKEVLQSFGKEAPNPDGISKLKTMGMIINESLRLYPPVVTLERKAGREVRLGKLLVPADTEIYIPCLALHNDPQFWGEDVHLFKPERFLEGVAKATNENMAAFMPFGMGPRMCVGLNFATIETKITLSMILQRFSFTLSPAYVHSPFRLLTVRPQHGVQVMLHSL